jgi:hypothetical protein
MAHWAQIDENNIVIRVTVGDNNDPNGDEGHKWLVDNLGGTWVKTSYNANFGKKFAGVGDTYSPSTGNFRPPQTFPSWKWSNTEWSWYPPVAYPTDGKIYEWNEEITEWVEIANG